MLICDDENDRVQIFDQEGRFLDEWKLANPSGLCIRDDIVYIAELQPFHDESRGPGAAVFRYLLWTGSSWRAGWVRRAAAEMFSLVRTICALRKTGISTSAR